MERVLARPKVVSIAGGTARFYILKGLKEVADITAIYNNIDSGGPSTGRLRVENGCLPYGDGTQACAALAATEEDERFLLDRFEKGEGINGHKIANLVCEVAVRKFGVVEGMNYVVNKFCIPGARVYPVSQELGVHLAVATLDKVFIGEALIDKTPKGGRIIDAWLTKEEQRVVNLKPGDLQGFKKETRVHVDALPEAVKAIQEADILLIGPGSLYGSQVGNLLVDNLPAEVRASKAIKINICNFANDTTETPGLSAEDHIAIPASFLSSGQQRFQFDYALLNKGFLIIADGQVQSVRVIGENDLDPVLAAGYQGEGKDFVRIKERRSRYQFVRRIIERPMVAVVRSGEGDVLRHYSRTLTDLLMDIYRNHLNVNHSPSNVAVAV